MKQHILLSALSVAILCTAYGKKNCPEQILILPKIDSITKYCTLMERLKELTPEQLEVFKDYQQFEYNKNFEKNVIILSSIIGASFCSFFLWLGYTKK